MKQRLARLWGVWLMLVLVAGCAGPGERTGATGTAGSGQPAAPKRVVAGIHGDPHTVYQQLNPASRVRGIEAIEQLLAAGLTLPDDRGIVRPQLAEAAPSLENGLLKLLPDGRMETTWHIRPGAQWHDGTPFTAHDVVFTALVIRDRDMPVFGNFAYEWIESVEAPDARTVLVRWNQPFIEAESLFSSIRGLPFQKQALEKAYAEEKAAFTDHPYWSLEYVGTGPFRLREWQRGSHLIVEANDQYVLGRPKIDAVEVRFIPDDNTLMANLLAGTVEMTLGRTLSGEHATEVRDQWRGSGRLELSFENWISLYPQFINANPPVVTELRFRQALLHAMDRQQMVDVFQPGLSSVAHSWLNPRQADYKEIEERNLVRYEYDPRRAAELIEALGYAKAGDGFYRDRSDQRLAVEVRTTADDDLRQKLLYATADAWQRTGVAVETVLIPRQRAADLEYRATFPSFEIVRQPNDVRGLRSIHSRNTALPENNLRVTGNRTRYVSPAVDGLIDAYFTTIPRPERMETMGRVVHLLSDQAVIMGILYNTSCTLVSNRIAHVTAGGQGSTQTWNSHEWEVR